MAVVFTNQPVVVGDTVDFTLFAQLNGVTWPSFGTATVQLYLRQPSEAWLAPLAVPVTDTVNAKADLTVANTVLVPSGDWAFQWRVTQGTIDVWSDIYTFPVKPSAIAA